MPDEEFELYFVGKKQELLYGSHSGSVWENRCGSREAGTRARAGMVRPELEYEAGGHREGVSWAYFQCWPTSSRQGKCRHRMANSGQKACTVSGG